MFVRATLPSDKDTHSHPPAHAASLSRCVRQRRAFFMGVGGLFSPWRHGGVFRSRGYVATAYSQTGAGAPWHQSACVLCVCALCSCVYCVCACILFVRCMCFVWDTMPQPTPKFVQRLHGVKVRVFCVCVLCVLCLCLCLYFVCTLCAIRCRKLLANLFRGPWRQGVVFDVCVLCVCVCVVSVCVCLCVCVFCVCVSCKL